MRQGTAGVVMASRHGEHIVAYQILAILYYLALCYDSIML
jgi:hypothetical protein